MIPVYNIGDFFETPVSGKNFHINRLEEINPLPLRIKSPHKHNFHEIFFLTEGEFQHNVDIHQYNIKGNQLFFIVMGQLHIWAKNLSPAIKGYRLMFNDAVFSSITTSNQIVFELLYNKSLIEHPLIDLNDSENSSILFYSEQLIKEYETAIPNVTTLNALLFLFLNEICKEVSSSAFQQKQRNSMNIFIQFNKLLSDNLTDHKGIDFYAENLAISSVKLNKVIKECSLMPFTKFVITKLLLEAKLLLVTTDLSVNEISYKLGYLDTSYFIRSFKKSEKTTPNNFRKYFEK